MLFRSRPTGVCVVVRAKFSALSGRKLRFCFKNCTHAFNTFAALFGLLCTNKCNAAIISSRQRTGNTHQSRFNGIFL